MQTVSGSAKLPHLRVKGVSPGGGGGVPPMHRLWDRTLDKYPENRARYLNLAIVVMAAIVLYYEFYVVASVTTKVIPHFGMTWPFFVFTLVVGNLVGAFASLLAGLSDRWGRANLVAYGLLVTGFVTLLMPHAGNLWQFATLYAVLGFVEGIILVATPALIRDFSPQIGRASAMGFWTMGPVIGSLAVSMVASHTLSHLTAWQDQFTIAGIAGLVVFAIALVGLRELAPGIRDQLMVSTRDRILVEARAAGIDPTKALEHPWRQMLHLDIVGSSLGIGIFLVMYYTLIAFLVVYMATIFGYSTQRANALGNWLWAFDALALVAVGVASDRLRVRKPFMVIGVLGTAVCTALFALRATQPSTSYYTFVVILSSLAVFIGFVFTPWLAAFTETVEARNPALTATGLAIWGWVLRIAVAGSLFVLPFVVTTMTPLVNTGTHAQELSVKYAPQLATRAAIDSSTLARLTANKADTVAAGKAVTEIVAAQKVAPAVALQKLVALGAIPQADVAYLNTFSKTATTSSHEWQRWWWISMAAELMLLPFVFVMKGRWSPKKAKQDYEEHSRKVEKALAALHASPPSQVSVPAAR